MGPLSLSARSALALLSVVLPGDPLPFVEEALERGLDYPIWQGLPDVVFGSCGAFCDLDGDGDPDVVLLGAQDGTVGVFENDGRGFFTDRSAASGVAPLHGASGVTAADYDGDGDLDLYLTRSVGKNRLHRNDGGFHFTSTGSLAGVEDLGAGMGSSWGDVNGDGWLDLYVANRTSTLGSELPNVFYRNRGDGTFIESAQVLGIDAGGEPTFQPVFFDMDLDGDQDLYLSTDKGYLPQNSNHLFRNDGGVLTEITTTSGTAANFNSMGVALGDLDANRRLDLYCTNTPQGNGLFLQVFPGIFADGTAQAGVQSFRLGWGTFFLDYDNDGNQDLYVGNMDGPNRLYVGPGPWPLADAAPELGVADPGITFGCVKADVDGDGDLDLLVSNWLGRARLYVNREGERRRFVRLRAVGTAPNRHAVGASVELRSGASWQMGQVVAGSSYKGQHELVMHFGLGGADRADEVRALWPGGVRRTLTGLPADRVWSLYPPDLLGDADLDGRVDQADYAVFLACRAAGGRTGFAPGCEAMDFDGDSDVDEVDHELFLRRFQAGKGSRQTMVSPP